MNSPKCEKCGDSLEKSNVESICYACSVETNIEELENIGQYMAEYDFLSE